VAVSSRGGINPIGAGLKTHQGRIGTVRDEPEGMPAIRITSGPLRGVELETGVQGRVRRMRLLARAWRRRSATPPITRLEVPPRP
jgi:hypothetical protein